MTFDWTAELTLPEDVRLVGSASLSPSVRARIGARPGDYLIQRAGSRDHEKLVDEDAARLLQSFRTPQRVADVVLRMAGAGEVSPHRMLDECFPLLERMVDAGLLSIAGSADAKAIEPLLADGERLGEW